MKLISLLVLVFATLSEAIAQQQQPIPLDGQRIRLQFGDAATYKEPRDLDIKSAVLLRSLSSGSRGSQFATVRILLSNRTGDLCTEDIARLAHSLSPLPLSNEADLYLALATFDERKNIADSDLHKMFFAEAPLHAFFVAFEGGDPERFVKQLFPDQHLVMTNLKRPSARTEIIPKGGRQASPIHFIFDMAPAWFIYHRAVKKPPMFIKGTQGHAIISREGDSARINFRVRGSKVVAEGNVSLQVCLISR